MEVNSIRKTLKKALPPTILSMVLLLVNLKFFGLSNIIIATYMTLTFIIMRTYLIIENNIFIHLFIKLSIDILNASTGLLKFSTVLFKLADNLFKSFVESFIAITISVKSLVFLLIFCTSS